MQNIKNNGRAWLLAFLPHKVLHQSILAKVLHQSILTVQLL